MDAEYIYCSSCEYEGWDLFVAYVRTCAGGDLWICPECGEETSQIER